MQVPTDGPVWGLGIVRTKNIICVGLQLLADGQISSGSVSWRKTALRLTFDKGVFSLRQKDSVSVRNQCVYRQNRPCCFCEFLLEDSAIVCNNVLFAIEIKRLDDITKSESRCLCEAQVQLVGLTIDDATSSPPLILTDLSTVHSVLYIDAKPTELRYVIKQIHCASFTSATGVAQFLGSENV